MTVYTPTSDSIVHSARVDMMYRGIPDVVHLVQYDNQTPILAVSMYSGSEPYAMPSGAAATLRVGKPDGTAVTTGCLGTSSDSTIVYFAVTEQMMAAAGQAMAVVELCMGDNIAASGSFILRVDRNPVQKETLESATEINILLMMSNIVVSSTQPGNIPVLWFDTSAV